jgi:putative hydrolase of HD superfamily
MIPERLEKQMAFIIEIGKLKHVLRRTITIDRDRNENDAEHSWHLAMMAVLLADHAGDSGIDLLRVLKMALIHDIVEIDAGDTYCYDEQANEDKREREVKAADRIFAMLPSDQAVELRSLWEEFEARRTPEARYAAALDRLQPLLLNYHAGGKSWRQHGVTRDQVIRRNQPVVDASPVLWRYARLLIDKALKEGLLQE